MSVSQAGKDKLRNAARWARRVWSFRVEGVLLGALGVMILAAIVGLAIVFATMAGCQSRPPIPGHAYDTPTANYPADATIPPNPGEPKPRPVAPTPQIPDGDTAIISTASTIGAVSRWTLALSALALVASFLPVVGSFIPRREVAYCGLAAIGLGIVQYWVLEYGRGFAIASFWIGLVLGVAMLGLVLYPVVRAMWRKALIDDAKNRVAAGDPIAATALHVAATPERFRTPGAKRAMLAALSSASGTLAHGRTPRQEGATDAPR